MRIFDFLYLFLIVIIVEIVFAKCFGICINKKINLNMFKFIIIVLIAALDVFNHIYNSSIIYRLSTSYLLTISLNLTIFKCNMKTSIFYTTFIFLIGTACELFITRFFLFIKLTNISSNDKIHSLLAFEILFTVINMILLLVIFKILRKAIKISKFNNFIQKNDDINLIAFVLFIMISFLLIVYGYDFKSIKNFLAAIITFIIVFAFIVTLIIKVNKEEKLVVRNKFLLERNNYFEIVREDYRILKHNLINDFLSIESIGNKQVKDLVKQKIKKYNKEYEWISNIEEIPNNLQGLIQLKILSAKKSGIDCYIDSQIKTNFLSKINMALYDNLSDAISISLDNAFEATKECEDKFVYIEIKENKKKIIIKIVNPFKNQIDIENIGSKNYSTKDKKRGIGLFSLTKLLNKNNVVLKRRIINNMFITSIITNKN